MTLGRGSVAPSMMVTEFDPVMHVVADRLHALPATRDVCKKGPGEIAEFFGTAIAASDQVDQSVIPKPIDFPQLRARCDFIRLSAIGDDEAVSNLEETGWSSCARRHSVRS
jgi:hypothetical protein